MPEHLLFADSLLDNSLRHRNHRGLSALASFGLQALAVALLVIAPLLYTHQIPSLHLTGRELVAPAPLRVQPLEPEHRSDTVSANHSFQLRPLIVRNYHPTSLLPSNDDPLAPSDPPPSLADFENHGDVIGNVLNSTGTGTAPYIPARPAVPKPPRVSRMMEGNLIHRVEPPYPPLARQARIQGEVLLRALISRTGTIENLQVVSGHPMLAPAAVNAVRQWRYRPYVLNGEPVEVETQVTVNFLLSPP